jgi:phosphate transport system permease protein
MAIIMVAGNAPISPASIFSPVRTLTGNIALEMAYSSGENTQALFATGIVLFVMIMLINSMAVLLTKRGMR